MEIDPAPIDPDLKKQSEQVEPETIKLEVQGS